MTDNLTFTAIDGIQVGHAHNLAGPTGCTVIICPTGTIGGVDQRGGAPGTRETDLLRPMHMVEQIHALLLTGGSAYGLNAAAGVLQYLEEQGIGHPTSGGVVPIVPGAVIFDLDLGDSSIRPDAEMGYAACQNTSNAAVPAGCVGAGAGARIGNFMGLNHAMKSGVGSTCITLPDGFKVAALFVVNALGDVIDSTGEVLAGTRQSPESQDFVDSMNILPQMVGMVNPPAPSNTVIGTVATNAQLTKEGVNKMAQMAHDGLARAIRPAHTMMDGDTIFGLATGTAGPANVSVIGAFAAEATAQAIRQTVHSATTLAGLPGLSG